MFRVRAGSSAFYVSRVVAFVFLLVLLAGNSTFSRAPSPVMAQEPTMTPNPLAIAPGGCTRELLNKLAQAAIQSWTDSGQLSPGMLLALLGGLNNCYAALDVAQVTTCDQQAVQRIDWRVLMDLISGQSLTGDEFQSLLQVLNTCYGLDVNANAVVISGAAGSGGAGNGGAGSGGGNGGGSGGTGSGDGSSQPGSTEEYLGPYQVVKIMNLGGETLDGVVCAINQPFVVHMHTPRINFDISFAPVGRTDGVWTYAYGFPDLGETHDARGQYTISAPAADGTRSLTINGSDHVVFNGFDGPFPMNYVMQLTPTEAVCTP